ncbi:IS110 family transposase, partial [Bradyrhizobium sp. ISRA442]|uniref:IS110 family transposase n=1 Tax=Bradyrhizobium sp. ISRA442 TaxID=2866197 RepID=UPI00311ACD5C
FCGLDVGMDETAICVVDGSGKVALEVAVVTDPDAIKAALTPYRGRLRRLGHEAGSLSPWLHPELLKLGLPAVCLETFHVRAALKAQRNKTDRTDALGLAHLMRTGWFRKAHIKSEACYRLRLLLTHRRNLKRKFLDLENAIRHSLKVFGIRLSHVGRGGFAQAVREAVAGDALVSELIDAMLNARAALWKEYCRLHDLVVKLVASHELCRRFMQIPGVGPVAALSFMTAIDDPARFKRSRDVAAYFGLTSRRWQSGSSIDVKGRI